MDREQMGAVADVRPKAAEGMPGEAGAAPLTQADGTDGAVAAQAVVDGTDGAEPAPTEDELYQACMRAVDAVVAQRQIYYKTLRLADSVDEDRALKEAVGQLPEMRTSLKTPGFFISEMVRLRALEMTPVMPQGAQGEGGGQADDAEAPAGVPAPAGAPEPAASPAASETPAAGDVADDAAPADGDPADGGASDAAPQPETYTYRLTGVGRRVIASLSPSRRLESLYARSPEQGPAFDFILDYCAEPKTRGKLDEELRARGMLAGREVGTSYFVDRLERAGGLVWQDGWVTTREGRDFLAQPL